MGGSSGRASTLGWYAHGRAGSIRALDEGRLRHTGHQPGTCLMSSAPSPQRGEVWLADLDPSFGHEQGGRRPILVVSVDSFNAGLSGWVVVLPITSRKRSLPLHIPIDPP